MNDSFFFASLEEIGAEEELDLVTDRILCIHECRVCGSAMDVHGNNDICIECDEKVYKGNLRGICS